MSKRIAIVGSRKFRQLHLVAKLLDVQFKRQGAFMVVSGGAQGVDRAAVKHARGLGLKTQVLLPNYGKYGRPAPLKRNTLIVQNCDDLYAFWDGHSTGTLDSIRKARKAGKLTEIILDKGDGLLGFQETLPCAECAEETYYVSISFEAPFCLLGGCLRKWWKEWEDAFNKESPE